MSAPARLVTVRPAQGPARRAPLTLQIIAAGLMVAPVFYFIMEALSANLPVTEPGAVIHHFGTLRLIGVILAPLVGIAVLMVSPVAWWATVGYAVYTIAFNVRAAAMGNTAAWKAVVFSSVGVLLITYFVRKEIRTPYFTPNLTVWVRDRVVFALRVEIKGRTDLVCKTFDISAGGCFLLTDQSFDTGEVLELTLHLPNGALGAKGSVVWRSDGRNGKPQGIGVCFSHTAPGFRAAVGTLSRGQAS